MRQEYPVDAVTEEDPVDPDHSVGLAGKESLAYRDIPEGQADLGEMEVSDHVEHQVTEDMATKVALDQQVYQADPVTPDKRENPDQDPDLDIQEGRESQEYPEAEDHQEDLPPLENAPALTHMPSWMVDIVVL